MDRADPPTPANLTEIEPFPCGSDNVEPCRGWLHFGHGHGYEWRRLGLPVRGLPKVLEGLRIVHLTDMHMIKRWRPAYDELHDRLRRDPPDLVLITGDFVDNTLDHRPALPIAERFCKGLTSRLGIFGITGNHDGDLLGPRLAGWNVQFIHRKMIRLETDEAAIELIGLPSVRRMSFDPDWIASLPARSEGVPRIVLAHYPDQVRYVTSLKADVVLSGHTHGGQICLPGGRALITHDTLPKGMARGVHRFGETLLVISRGLGTTRWPIRMFCSAQVIEVRLTGIVST